MPQRPGLVYGLLLLPFWALLGSSPAAAGPTLAATTQAINSPTIGPEVKLAGPLRVARATVTLATGTRAFQLLAGDQPCGVYIGGPATLTYAIDDRFSVPVAKRNLRRVSKLRVSETGSGLEIVEPLESALIWSFDLPLPPISDGAAAPADLPQWVADILDRPFFTLPARDLLPARRLGVAGAVWALFDSKNHPLHLVTEPHRGRVELFYRLEKSDSIEPELKNRFLPRFLAAQPLDRQWWDRFPGVLVMEHAAISVDNPADQRVVVETAATLRATRGGVDLWQVGLAEDILFESRLLPNRVVSVTVEGQAADHVHMDNELVVSLPRQLRQGETVTVRVVNEGDLAIRWRGDNFWSLGTWSWYPQPDLNSELATFDLQVRVPAGYTPFASGKVTFEDDEGDTSVVKTRLDKPMQFPVVAAGKYTVYSETRGGITCRVATYATQNKKGAQRLIQNFFAAAEFYEKIFGVPYPFDGFTVVERNRWGFGQAPPGIIFITQEAFNLNPRIDRASQLFSQGVNERYVHEIAHAWWGHVLKMDSWEEQWLTEGFASYSAALCLEAMHGGGKKGKRAFNDSLRVWQARTRDVDSGGSIYLANHLSFEGDGNLDRRALLYGKGPLVLHALRQQLGKDQGSEKEGDRVFVILLRSFLKNFTHSWGTTQHLIGILNQITGKDWQPWFERYVYGTEVPAIDL